MGFEPFYILRRLLRRKRLKIKLLKLKLREKGLLYNVIYGDLGKNSDFFLKEFKKVTEEIEYVTTQINRL